MSDAWQSIKIRRFEHMTAGPSTSLLRISGKPPWRRGASQRPTLLVDKNGDAHRFAALPAPSDPRGTLRAAYSVPSALIGDDSKFWLEHADGSLTELAAPVPGAGRSEAHPAPGAPPSPSSEAGGDQRRNGHTDAESLPEVERRSDLHAKLADQSRELARAERHAFESDQARRLAETELARAREAIGQVEARAKEAEQRNQELEQTVLEQQERIESLDSLVAETQPDNSALERELAALRSGRASLEQELDQSRDQLRIMTFERDELSRQAAAFDGIAVKARERATKAEARNEDMAATLRELDVWRGELERRLAATTSELGVAKAAREADERELKRLHEALTEAESREGQPADSSQTVAAQAAEIELLVAELASLRAEQSASGSGTGGADGQAVARIAALEAERAELTSRVEQLSAALKKALGPAQALAELAQSSLDRGPATDADADAETELISRSAERSAREQAERELRAAAGEYSRGPGATD